MKIHHLNCGTLCPFGAALIGDEGGVLAAGRMVCHCLLIEGDDGLILVDTGVGTLDCREPNRLGRPFRAAIRPRCDARETALARVRELGFEAGDVRHIVATHLDLDHAGGLPDFPDAAVHVFAPEHAAAVEPSLKDRPRYLRHHFAHGPRWSVHEPGGDDWHGFASIRVLPDSVTEVLLVPLVGHSAGHAGVAINTGERWLLHCGDAYFFHAEVETPPRCPPGLRAFQSLTNADGKQRRANQERLRELAARDGDEVDLVCAHDAHTLDRALANP